MPKPGHAIKRLNVHFQFGQHATREDAENILGSIAKHSPHLIVPEFMTFKNQVERIENAIERGEVPPGVAGNPLENFARREIQLIAQKKLPIKVLEVFETERITNLMKQRNSAMLLAADRFIDGRIDEALAQELLSLELDLERHRLREGKIFNGLKD
ncbi:MAG: hypothetical protein Q7K42_02615, partial [Candidatus Diapherotrites archaeon]|nr:hypothetical protein [Candidatus Diapherotrites archaeon]